MKVYTKTGDKGETSLFTGKRVSKTHNLVGLFGFFDELNVSIGRLNFSSKKSGSTENFELEDLQSKIFSIGSFLASEGTKAEYLKGLSDLVLNLEAKIDKMTELLPPLKNFILPGGGESALDAHQCRVIARKLERNLVELKAQDFIKIDEVIQFMNRLSDYFFVLSRYLNFLEKQKETLWKA